MKHSAIDLGQQHTSMLSHTKLRNIGVFAIIKLIMKDKMLLMCVTEGSEGCRLIYKYQVDT